ncbi:hypothetical protein FQZ97_1177740 [compost metagenome]
MARCERRLLAAVFNCTRTIRQFSKAWRSIRYFTVLFRPVPCWLRSNQVQPISAAGRVGRKSPKRVVPTSCSPRRMTNGSALPSRWSSRPWRYQSRRWVPLM